MYVKDSEKHCKHFHFTPYCWSIL